MFTFALCLIFFALVFAALRRSCCKLRRMAMPNLSQWTAENSVRLATDIKQYW